MNPDLRFQRGDIGPAMPNFARYYDYGTTGLYHYGLPIPSAAAFAADFTRAFGVAPALTDAELALIDRAATAPQRAVLPGRAFPITSGYGYIVPGNPFTRHCWRASASPWTSGRSTSTTPSNRSRARTSSTAAIVAPP